MDAVPQRSSPRRSPERMEVDSPLPVPVQPQSHHQPPQPPSQPLQQFVMVSPQLPAEQLRPTQSQNRPAFTHRCLHRHILTIPTANRLKRPRRARRSSPRRCIRPVHHENNRRGTTSIRFRTPTSRMLTRTARNSFTLHPSICRVPSRRRRYCRWRRGNCRHHQSPGGSQGRHRSSSTLSLCMGEVDRFHRFRFQGQQLRSALISSA
jgi:hypothetical protein